MKHTNRNSRQRGAALIVGLILLAVITLLAVVGMNISNSELASANSEQIRLRAFQAAESGLEYGILAVQKMGTGSVGVPQKQDPVPVEGSPEDIDGNPIDSYTLTLTARGEGYAPNFSQDYHAFYFEVQSDGKSSRNALVTNESGAFYVGNAGSTDTFEKLPE